MRLVCFSERLTEDVILLIGALPKVVEQKTNLFILGCSIPLWKNASIARSEKVNWRNRTLIWAFTSRDRTSRASKRFHRGSSNQMLATISTRFLSKFLRRQSEREFWATCMGKRKKWKIHRSHVIKSRRSMKSIEFAIQGNFTHGREKWMTWIFFSFHIFLSPSIQLLVLWWIEEEKW